MPEEGIINIFNTDASGNRREDKQRPVMESGKKQKKACK